MWTQAGASFRCHPWSGPRLLKELIIKKTAQMTETRAEDVKRFDKVVLKAEAGCLSITNASVSGAPAQAAHCQCASVSFDRELVSRRNLPFPQMLKCTFERRPSAPCRECSDSFNF